MRLALAFVFMLAMFLIVAALTFHAVPYLTLKGLP